MNDHDEELPWHVLPDKLYDPLKWLLLIVLPALGTFYFALAQIWGLPAAEEIMGTVLAVQAFLGVVLGISSKGYNASDAKYDGTLSVTDTPTKTIVSVEGKDPEKLVQKDQVLLKVK